MSEPIPRPTDDKERRRRLRGGAMIAVIDAKLTELQKKRAEILKRGSDAIPEVLETAADERKEMVDASETALKNLKDPDPSPN